MDKKARSREILGKDADSIMRELSSISPDFAQYIMNFVFGDLYQRPMLSDKHKELIVVSNLIGQGRLGFPLKTHLGAMLTVGWTKDEIIELIILLIAYMGFPSTVEAIKVAQEVFAKEEQAKVKSLESYSLRLSKILDQGQPPFCNLQQLYEFEFSLVTDYTLNSQGLYEASNLRRYWSGHGTDIYELYEGHNPIGFAVINLGSMLDNNPEIRDIAEFFVMPKYRQLGVGKWMAHTLFSMYPGKWEVRQLRNLTNARKFWHKTISSYTDNDFKEEEITEEDMILDSFNGFVQKFIAK